MQDKNTSTTIPMPDDLAKPEFDENAMRVLKERYFAKKADGTTENSIEFVWRVASAIAKPEGRFVRAGHNANDAVSATARQFYDMMAARDFLPNTPCLVNAGRPLSMLSACFVLDVPDSIEGIADAVKSQMLIQKAGGGTGFAFSNLRSSGSLVYSTGKESSGPIAFMKVFDAATNSIKQGGVRRGANMGVLKVNHPDIFAFMECKKELDNENRALHNRMIDKGIYDENQLAIMKQELLQTQFANFNISIGITEPFMQAVKADSDFDLIDPATKKAVRTVKAREIWDAIVEGAWQNGEPGVLFLDHPEFNPLPGLGPIEATNPCGEQGLHGGDSCNLGSINLGHFVRDGKVDYARLAKVSRLTTRFLDNVIEENLYTQDHIATMVRGNRRIGLGIMGFADMLAMLRIDYGTAESIKLAEDVMFAIKTESLKESEVLANERGEFPNKHLSIYKDEQRPRRNAALLSIAPTGTISMIAGCSFGCEPWFGITYVKNVMKGADGRAQTLYYKTPAFEKAYLAKYGQAVPDEVYEKIAKNGGSIQGLDLGIGSGFAVTSDVTVEGHIDMLAAFQKHTCNAVSKTVNAPNEDTRESVARSIMRAYKTGCKGFTYYRDGSRSEQVVDIKAKPASPTATMKDESIDLASLLARASELVSK